MEFDSVKREVFGLYEDGRYEAALMVVATARPDHPDQDARLTFWEACLLGVSDRPEEALHILELGLDQGLWWALYRLADTDLDSLHDLPGWENVAQQSEEVAANFMANHPARPQLRPAGSATPSGTVITLHGAGDDPIIHFERWSRAVPDTWTVVAPTGTVPISTTDRAWPPDGATRIVIGQISDIDYPAPVVVAGYSQGAGVAALLAWEGRLDARGLILATPSLRDEPWAADSDAGVPTFIVVGEHDRSLDDCVELQERLEEAGVPVVLDLHKDLGHQQPEHLDQVLATALDWVTS